MYSFSYIVQCELWYLCVIIKDSNIYALFRKIVPRSSGIYYCDAPDGHSSYFIIMNNNGGLQLCNPPTVPDGTRYWSRKLIDGTSMETMSKFLFHFLCYVYFFLFFLCSFTFCFYFLCVLLLSIFLFYIFAIYVIDFFLVAVILRYFGAL